MRLGKRLLFSETRGLSLVIILIVLLVLLFGVYKAFTLPGEVEKEITVVNYEHRGEFDYLAHLNASYLFGDIPLETGRVTPEYPPTTPKYPIEMIDSLSMSFSYRFVSDTSVIGTSQEVEVTAVLDRPDREREEITLVPERTEMGDFTVYFSLVESELALISKITINAYVYATVETDKGPMFESFTQSLAMRSDGPLLEVDRTLTKNQQASFGELSYEQVGEFDYSILLKSSSPFGAITLKPPSATPLTPPTLPSSKTLGPGEPLFSSLLDSMDVTFSYQFESDRPVSQIAEEVEINAILENPNVWSKTFVLVPLTKKTGDFTVTFPLDSDDLGHFRDVFMAIERETSVSSSHNLIIEAEVHTIAQTDFGPIDEVFSQTLTTTLGENILKWQEELAVFQPGSITTSQIIPNPNKYWGLSVSWIRNLSAILSGVAFLLFLYLLMLNIKFKPAELSWIEAEALRARKKYKGLIADIKELPEAKAEEMVISLNSLDELVKTADSLLKPVLHKSEPRKHTYCVIDGLTRYQYVLSTRGKGQRSNAKKAQ
jgi:hypothetical protein